MSTMQPKNTHIRDQSDFEAAVAAHGTVEACTYLTTESIRVRVRVTEVVEADHRVQVHEDDHKQRSVQQATIRHVHGAGNVADTTQTVHDVQDVERKEEVRHDVAQQCEQQVRNVVHERRVGHQENEFHERLAAQDVHTTGHGTGNN